jgi:hypothetical protein
MGLTPEVCDFIRQTARSFKTGAPRRLYMAQTLETFGLGQRQAQRLLGWGRDTLRKALHERRTGITCADAFSARGRKPAEVHLPRLLDDIKDIVQDHVQTDPTFATTRLYCRLSAARVRQQLIDRKGYTHQQLPSIETITNKLNALGFRLRKVAKCRPKKSKGNRRHLRQPQGGP